jgi:hypothetical protein
MDIYFESLLLPQQILGGLGFKKIVFDDIQQKLFDTIYR